MARESIVEDASWMGSSKTVVLAWSVWAAVAVLVTASVVAPPLHPDLASFAPIAASFAGVGGFLVLRRPGNPVGWSHVK